MLLKEAKLTQIYDYKQFFKILLIWRLILYCDILLVFQKSVINRCSVSQIKLDQKSYFTKVDQNKKIGLIRHNQLIISLIGKNLKNGKKYKLENKIRIIFPYT